MAKFLVDVTVRLEVSAANDVMAADKAARAAVTVTPGRAPGASTTATYVALKTYGVKVKEA